MNSNQPRGEKSTKVFNNQWILKKKVSSGSFGVVFIGQDKNTKDLVAIKLEKEDNEEIRSLDREVSILKKLHGLPQVPQLYWSGCESSYNIMVLSLLGKDLAHFMKQQKTFSLKTVLMLVDQLIPIIEQVHNRSVIHRDLKPENILMGRDNTSHLVYLIDFGISKVYRDSSGRHIPLKEKKPFLGTTRYASIAAHQGYELGRKDDLESLGYILVFFLKGHLPWQNLQNVPDRDKTEVVGEVKMKTKTSDLCKDLPQEFVKYFDYIKKLHFKNAPDYKYLKNLFLKLGQQQNVKYSTGDYDWHVKEKDSYYQHDHHKSQMLSSFQGNSLLVPPGPGRQKQRSTSLTPSQRSANSSRRTSNASYFSASKNSVYIKYNQQGSMYKPNSSMNFDDDIFNYQQHNNNHQQKQPGERGYNLRHNSRKLSNMRKMNQEVIKEEQKTDQQSSSYFNIEMEEWNSNTLDKKIKFLENKGVGANSFLRNKSIKFHKGMKQ